MKFVVIFAAVLAVACATAIRSTEINEDIGEEFVVLPRSQLVSNFFDSFREIFRNGDPARGIPVLAPFVADHLPIHLDLENFIDLDIDFRNFRMEGIDSFVYNGGSFGLLSLRIEFDLTVPSMNLQGMYNANGNVFGLVPVFGNGNFQIIPRNIRARGHVVIAASLGGGVSINNMNIVVDPVQLTSNIDGLLTGGDLSVLINAVIQDIIPQVMINFDREVQAAINAIALPIVQDVLSTFTFLDLIGMLT